MLPLCLVNGRQHYHIRTSRVDRLKSGGEAQAGTRRRRSTHRMNVNVDPVSWRVRPAFPSCHKFASSENSLVPHSPSNPTKCEGLFRQTLVDAWAVFIHLKCFLLTLSY